MTAEVNTRDFRIRAAGSLKGSMAALLLSVLPADGAVGADAHSPLSCVAAIGSETLRTPEYGDTETVYHLPDGRLLIHHGGELTLAHIENGTIRAENVMAIDTGEVTSTYELPGANYLIGSQNGLYLLRTGSANPGTQPVAAGSTGTVLEIVDFFGAEQLIRAERGLFLASVNGGKVTLRPAMPFETGAVSAMLKLSGGNWLIQAEKGWFLIHFANGSVSASRAGTMETGNVLKWSEVPGLGALIAAQGGLYFARIAGNVGALELVHDARLWTVKSLHPIPGLGAIVATENIVFLVRLNEVKTGVHPLGIERVGSVRKVHVIAGGGALIKHTSGWYFVTSVGDDVKTLPLGNMGMGFADLAGFGVLMRANHSLVLIRSAGENRVGVVGQAEVGAVATFLPLSGNRVLINGQRGWFLAEVRNDQLVIEKIGTADTGPVEASTELAHDSVLLRGEKSWYVARLTTGKTSIVPVAGADTGSVKGLHEMLNRGALVQGERGWFLARFVDDGVSFRVLPTVDTGDVLGWQDVPGKGTFIFAENGWFFFTASDNSLRFLARAQVELWENRPYLLADGSVLISAEQGWFVGVGLPLSEASVRTRPASYAGPPPAGLFDLVFEVRHPCAKELAKMGIHVKVIAPSGKSDIQKIGRIEMDGEAAQVFAPVRIDAPGKWKFQLVSTFGSQKQGIGNQLSPFDFDAPAKDWKSLLEQWGWWIAGLAATLLALANAVLFFAARRSRWAWRVATDAELGTAVLRVATVTLSHIRWAQVWILDLYFHIKKRSTGSPHPFLVLPLSSSDGTNTSSPSDEIAAPSWKGKRIWIQGNSGMGKTALFQHVTTSHFRSHASAFEAFAEWDCVVVPFAARDFAGSSDDDPDPAWVINCIKATLSQSGLTFEDDTLLRRVLHSGTLAVAIDGLHEASRPNAVDAFARTFMAAPMLVTSQEPGSKAFVNWRLPSNMGEFTSKLLEVYLGPEAAAVVMSRIVTSGLNDAIRSGYDVRLVIDLAKGDPQGAPLPTNRKELYEAVIALAWPIVAEETRREQLDRASAAAWRMVSERGPHEDKRRLKANDDLAEDLLAALADATERDGRPVRLVRRVRDEFEFVHDQMHAYLAARWFAQEGRSVDELHKMLAGSAIWTDTVPARRTLWSFVATLLDDERIVALWSDVEDVAEWDGLRRELKAVAEVRGLQYPESGATRQHMPLERPTAGDQVPSSV